MRVAGIKLPAFVERSPSDTSARRARARVAGIKLPASVERASWPLTAAVGKCCVAGIKLPAFVERSLQPGAAPRTPVSPGLNSRPSLSARHELHAVRAARVSPGLNSRPSLSGVTARIASRRNAGVAGIKLPAFVERGRNRSPCRTQCLLGTLPLPTDPSSPPAQSSSRFLLFPQAHRKMGSRRWRPICPPRASSPRHAAPVFHFRAFPNFSHNGRPNPAHLPASPSARNVAANWFKLIPSAAARLANCWCRLFGMRCTNCPL